MLVEIVPSFITFDFRQGPLQTGLLVSMQQQYMLGNL